METKNNLKLGDMVTVSDLNLTIKQLTLNIEKCRLENLCQYSPNKTLETHKQAYIYFQRYKPTNWELSLHNASSNFTLRILRQKDLEFYFSTFKVKYIGPLEYVDDVYASKIIIANKDSAFVVWSDGVKKCKNENI